VITAIVVGVLIGVGVLTSLTGAVGVLRLPDVYSRVQSSTKNLTLGTIPVLIALVVGEGIDSTFASRALLLAVLLLIVNPAASHVLLRAAWKVGVPQWSGAVTGESRDQG
jgi:multicomponent Na+:H+ antiporter subunit G